MSFFKVPPAPKSHLGIYRMLAPNAAVRVSPLCLGTMNFGDAWYVPIPRSYYLRCAAIDSQNQGLI